MINLNDIKIIKDVPLKELCTFAIGGVSDFFIEAKTEDQIIKALEFGKNNNLPIFILSYGSNILINDTGFRGLIISINTQGITEIKRNKNDVYLQISAGEIWDNVVKYAVQHKLWGTENLSYIPGKTGAFVVQNVGAYGQEISNLIDSIKVIDCKTLQQKKISHKKCKFGYRSSIFNTTHKNKYVITDVILKLKLNGTPIITYPDLIDKFDRLYPATLKNIRTSIINTRTEKLPNLKHTGTAGCFFKNIIYKKNEFQIIKDKILKLVSLTQLKKFKTFENTAKDFIKIPAGFLIEICNLKGLKEGSAQIDPNNGVVIISNNKKATAKNVLELFKITRQTVYKKTGIKLINEPELIGFSKQELINYFKL